MAQRFMTKGFTMIELLIVITIMGIVAAIAVPLFSSSVFSYRARAEARELVIQFKKAKLEAVKRNRDVYINFTNVAAANSGYQIFVNVDRDTNSPHTFDQAAGDILLINKNLNPNVQITSSTFTTSPTVINFQAGYNSRGLPLQLVANQNLIMGASGSRSYTLSVSMTGNVRIQ